jgi:hypothetical protein
MSSLHKLSDTLIAWTPNEAQYPPALRGSVVLLPAGTPLEQLKCFTYLAGACDSRGMDPRSEVRQAHALAVAFTICMRDNCDALAVHRMMLGVEEYADGCASDPPQPARAGR